MDRDWSAKQVLLGIYLLVVGILLVWLLLKFWPTPLGEPSGAWDKQESVLKYKFQVNDETRFLLLVVLVGALGSYVHAATSFVTYTGTRSFVDSWTWWYILRPCIGMALALVFYLVIRGGFLALSNTSDTEIDLLSLYGMTGIAGLVGLCSKQASDKLREVFDSLFTTGPGKGDEARTDKLGEQLPVEKVMIPHSKMTKIDITDERPEDAVTISELLGLLKGIVTRIPVLDKGGIVKYVIHESLLFKFVAEESLKAAEKNEVFAPANLTLEQFLGSSEMRKLVSGSMAFVPLKATLAEAKAAMMKKDKCRDVFVTESGGQDEPVKGWLTNIEIERYCRT